MPVRLRSRRNARNDDDDIQPVQRHEETIPEANERRSSEMDVPRPVDGELARRSDGVNDNQPENAPSEEDEEFVAVSYTHLTLPTTSRV